MEASPRQSHPVRPAGRRCECGVRLQRHQPGAAGRLREGAYRGDRERRRSCPLPHGSRSAGPESAPRARRRPALHRDGRTISSGEGSPNAVAGLRACGGSDWGRRSAARRRWPSPRRARTTRPEPRSRGPDPLPRRARRRGGYSGGGRRIRPDERERGGVDHAARGDGLEGAGRRHRGWWKSRDRPARHRRPAGAARGRVRDRERYGDPPRSAGAGPRADAVGGRSGRFVCTPSTGQSTVTTRCTVERSARRQPRRRV